MERFTPSPPMMGVGHFSGHQGPMMPHYPFIQHTGGIKRRHSPPPSVYSAGHVNKMASGSGGYMVSGDGSYPYDLVARTPTMTPGFFEHPHQMAIPNSMYTCANGQTKDGFIQAGTISPPNVHCAGLKQEVGSPTPQRGDYVEIAPLNGSSTDLRGSEDEDYDERCKHKRRSSGDQDDRSPPVKVPHMATNGTFSYYNSPDGYTTTPQVLYPNYYNNGYYNQQVEPVTPNMTYTCS